jgi:hypothetical protein
VTWRTVDGADDDASAIAMARDGSVGVCLIAVELGAPFLYEIAVVPEWRGCGVAALLLGTSLRRLEAEGHDLIAAWVTCGNEPSEKLPGLGWFRPGHAPARPHQRHQALSGGDGTRGCRRVRPGAGDHGRRRGAGGALGCRHRWSTRDPRDDSRHDGEDHHAGPGRSWTG